MPRAMHTAVLLSNGQVLLAGGGDQTGYLMTGELFDSTSGTSAMPGVLGDLHYHGPALNHTTTLLPNGQVLINGGQSGTEVFIGSEIFVPQQ